MLNRGYYYLVCGGSFEVDGFLLFIDIFLLLFFDY